jgi:7-cyano-7-deazaguanine synthase
MEEKRAVVLLSGGLDSTTVLAFALASGYECMTLNIDYGQRHAIETTAAEHVYDFLAARYPNALQGFETCRLPDFGHLAKSALTDCEVDVPQDRDEDTIGSDLPATYVPMRNTLFLSLAFALAESHGMSTVYHGANILDYSGYPDCRPEFFAAMRVAISEGSSYGDRGVKVRIFTPIIKHTKAQVIELAIRTGAPLALTHSCYSPMKDGSPCGKCDSCTIRARGFASVGIPDPALQSWETGEFTPYAFLPDPPEPPKQ